MIQEDYVSFEVAKLLKERGFKSDNCHTAYDENGSFFWYGDYSKDRKGIMDAPTLQMARKWLEEVHNLFITVDRHYFVFDKISHIVSGYEYSFEIKQINPVYKKYNCKSYQEACEVAIQYCLENLI